MYRPRSNNEWAFLGTMTAQAVCTVALDLILLLKYFSWINPVVYEVPRSYVMPLQSGVFILGNIVQGTLAFDALRGRNSLQLMGICIFNSCIFVFSVMRYFQTKTNAALLSVGYNGSNIPFVKADVDFEKVIAPTLLPSTIIVGVCALVSYFLTIRLSSEFAWAIYRQVSGDIKARRRYLAYQVLLVLLKLEVYFFVAFILVYAFIDVHYAIPEFPITIALIPILLILLSLTILSIKHENMLGAIIAMFLRLCEIAYIISRFIILNGDSLLAKTLLIDEMQLFLGVALALAVPACINAIICINNFGHGLKPILMDSSWKRSGQSFVPMHAQSQFAERLELD